MLFAGAGERRQRTFEVQFALPPVATRNGLAPPLRIGAPANDRKGKTLVRLPTNSATDPKKVVPVLGFRKRDGLVHHALIVEE
jgi:hypothetical protein